MSECTENAVEQEEDKAASKRKTLSLGERIKVVDYLRSQVEPIVADSNAAVAGIVSVATGIEINWQQLKYMIDDPTMAEWNLGAKVHVKVASSSDEAAEARIVHLEASVITLTRGLEALTTIVALHKDRLDKLQQVQ